MDGGGPGRDGGGTSGGRPAAAGGAATLVLRTHLADETRSAGATLGRVLLERGAAGAVVVLTGPLGAGKTCFVQGLASGLGTTGYVRSPTFVLIHEYPGPVRLFHVDLYRLREADLDALGLEELMDTDGVTVLEWGERAGALPDHLRVAFAFGRGEDDRVLTVTADSERYRAILLEVAACASSR